MHVYLVIFIHFDKTLLVYRINFSKRRGKYEKKSKIILQWFFTVIVLAIFVATN